MRVRGRLRLALDCSAFGIFAAGAAYGLIGLHDGITHAKLTAPVPLWAAAAGVGLSAALYDAADELVLGSIYRCRRYRIAVRGYLRRGYLPAAVMWALRYLLNYLCWYPIARCYVASFLGQPPAPIAWLKEHPSFAALALVGGAVHGLVSRAGARNGVEISLRSLMSRVHLPAIELGGVGRAVRQALNLILWFPRRLLRAWRKPRRGEWGTAAAENEGEHRLVAHGDARRATRESRRPRWLRIQTGARRDPSA